MAKAMAAPMDANAAAASRSGAIYAALRQAITDRALLPGDKLTEDAIGERFGASRTLVREALMRLKAEGLVDVQPNRGATVSRPSLDEARDVFAARACLEKDVIAKLVPGITARQLAALDAHVSREEKLGSSDALESARFSGAFHVLLAEMAGNRVVTRYVNELVTRCALIIALYGQAHSSDCAVSEHRAIIEALRKRRGADAVALMAEHLGALEGRALLHQPKRRPELRDILGVYAERSVEPAGTVATTRTQAGGRAKRRTGMAN